MSLFWSPYGLTLKGNITSSRSKNKITKTYLLCSQIIIKNIPLMDLTADRQEGRLCVMHSHRAAKIHKLTCWSTHTRTIRSIRPQDVIATHASYRAHLCCTYTSCLSRLLPVSVCVAFLMWVVGRFRFVIFLMKPDSCKQYLDSRSGSTCFHKGDIYVTYLWAGDTLCSRHILTGGLSVLPATWRKQVVRTSLHSNQLSFFFFLNKLLLGKFK